MNEEYFIQLISSQLKGFKKSGSTYNFRCPYCEDSKRSKSKQRGYLINKNGWYYYCHNCQLPRSFKQFLKELNEEIYQTYVLDNFNETGRNKPVPIKKVIPFIEENFNKLPKISSLKPNHSVKRMIIERQIPTDFHHKMFLCRQFKQFTNLLIPDKFKDFKIDEARIIIPIYYQHKIVGYQGRAIGPSDAKYITIVLDEEKSPLIFNYDNVSWNEPFFVMEGVFDSVFIPNSIAACGSGLLRAVERLNRPKNYSILVFDNEPRNESNINHMRKAIAAGYRICIFPATFHFKDTNDYILSVVGKQDFVQTEIVRKLGFELRDMFKANTYFGLSAELKLAEWSKV